MNEYIEIVYDNEDDVSEGIYNKIAKILKFDSKIDTYEECYLSAVLANYNNKKEDALNYYLSALDYVDDINKQANIYQKIGEVYTSNSNYSQAIEYYNKVLVIDENNSRALLYKAECYFKMENYETASQLLESYATNNQLSANQYEIMLTMYMNLKKYDEAIKTCDLAINEYSDLEKDFLSYKILIHILNGDEDESYADAKRYCELDNNKTDPVIILATSYYSLKQYDKALYLYLTYLENHDDLDLYSQAIECAYLIDNYDVLLYLSNNALEKCEDESDKVDYYKWKAIALMQLGYYCEAIDDFDSYLKINPTLYEITYLRGLCYCSLGDYNKAIEDFTLVIDKENSLVEDCLYNRSLSYIEINELELAKSDLEEIVSLESGSDTYISAIELLKSISS